jgi:dCTP deaminase
VILTDREIQLALERDQIVISPQPDIGSYSSTSVDLRLDDLLSEFKDGYEEDAIEKPIIDPGNKNYVAERTLLKLTTPVTIGSEGYVLTPSNFVLGWTKERVALPIFSRLAARVEGKSSLARLGLIVHLTAPVIHAGFANPIRLEIVNHGKFPIRLRSGMRICQLVFEMTLGTPQKGFEAIQSARLPPTGDS